MTCAQIIIGGTWSVVALASLFWISAHLAEIHQAQFDLNQIQFRSVWWVIINIAYVIFSLWAIFFNQTPEIYAGCIVATFFVVNEAFIELCDGIARDTNRIIFLSTETKFVFMSLLFIELILWKHDIVINNNHRISVGASTNMLGDKKKPFYTSIRDDDLFIPSKISDEQLQTLHDQHSVIDIDESVDTLDCKSIYKSS